MSSAKINNPDEIECTLEFSMKLKDWKQVRKTLGSNACYTELQIINEIADLVNRLEQTVYADVDSQQRFGD